MKKYLLFALLFGLIAVAACTVDKPVDKNPDVKTISSDFSQLSGSQKLMKFDNIDQAKDFLAQRDGSSNFLGSRGGVMVDAVSSKEMSASAPQAGSSGGTGGGASDYSQTNIQVAGVDEADYVKNDDRYIYMIAANKLIIIDALDAQNAKIISETRILENDSDYYGNSAREIFINGNKLVMFVNSNDKGFYFQKYDITPQPTYTPKTDIYIYDVSDRSNPELSTHYSVSGQYYSSRMIGDFVYIISQSSAYYSQLVEPVVMDVTNAKIVSRPGIYYFDNPDNSYQFNTIASINLADNSVVDTKTFMLGYSNTLMVSENNIYIAYQKQRFWCWSFRCGNDYEKGQRTRFMEVVVPLLRGELMTGIRAILQGEYSDDEEWTKISEKLDSFYMRLQNDENMQNEYKNMFENIDRSVAEYDEKKAMEDQATTIHKINIKDGMINYRSKGEVEGTLLNQFSLDENDGNLRVATTTNVWFSRGRANYNNVYILNADMNIIGSVKNIAENESIQSTRFLGDKLYIVTFRQIDPFFVIDLSNPANPKVLGQLKIPGFSTYLHPMDEDHIIGVGRQTDTNEYGGVIQKGLKISLFDVSDFENPREVSTYEIGDSGSDSPALHEHKAFLYSSTKNILVLPVTEVTQREKLSQYMYSTNVWHGAYVFKATASGFELLGKVKHSSMDSSYYGWWDQTSVMRSLYMDNNLYTISGKYIKINDLNDGLKDLKTISLPYNQNYPYMYY